MFLEYPHSLVFLIASIVSALITVLVWFQRRTDTGSALAGLMASVTVWTFASSIEAIALGQPLKIVWSQIQYCGNTNVAPFFLLFVIRYTNIFRRVSPRWFIALWLIPIATVLLAWTNPMHHWLWTDFRMGSVTANVLIYERGWWFYLFTVYIYVVIIAAIVILFRFYLSVRTYAKWQVGLMLVSAVFPFITGLMYVFDWVPFEGMDVSGLGFAASGMLIAWSLLRFRLLDLVPVGRNALIEQLPDGMVVIDSKGRIADINPTAQKLCFTGKGDIIGFEINSVLGPYRNLADVLQSLTEGELEVELEKNPPVFCNVRIIALRDNSGWLAGRLVLLHDITERVSQVREREKMIKELQDALAQIKTLRGLIPICASCKNIRDDSGYWKQIELYVREHSEAEFSHAICPDCLKKLYPWYKADQ